MRCDVCNTDNDTRLTFCRSCGNRLRSKVVAPTPATGVAKADVRRPAEQPDPDRAPSGGGAPSGGAAPRLSRPSAPPLKLRDRLDRQPQPAAAEPAAAEPAAARRSRSAGEPAGAEDGAQVTCGECGSASPQNYRFCLGCGSVLRGPRRGRRSEAGAGVDRSAGVDRGDGAAARGAAERDEDRLPQQRATRASEGGAQPPAPSADRGPVADHARGAEAHREEDDEEEEGVETVVCTRCRGTCEKDEAFCKYCGAPLAAQVKVLAAQVKGLAAQLAGQAASPKGNVDQARAKASPAADARPVAIQSLKEPFPLAPSIPVQEPAPRLVQPNDDALTARAAEEEVTGRLVVIVEDGSEGKALALRGRQLDVGSSEGNIVLGEDRYLSPRHARFFRQDGAWYLRDLDSINGVYRRLRKPEPLRDGDLVLLGLEVLQFHTVNHAERGLGHAVQHGTLVFGSPAATRRARLCQRTVEGVVRDVYHLVSDETTIGREIGDIVFTSDPFMSRRHAIVRWREATQDFELADLSSSNGTYLAIRDDVRLENGDFIRLGQHLFRVDLPQRTVRTRN